MTRILLILFLFIVQYSVSQTKVGGIVVDESGEPVSFANVLFKDSSEGTITNDNGRFYMESENAYTTLLVSFIGYETKEITLTTKVTYNMNVYSQSPANSWMRWWYILAKPTKKIIRR